MSVQVYFLLSQSKEERKAFFRECKKEGRILKLHPRVVIRDGRLCLFVKFKIILPFLYCLLDPLTNKHCREWCSVINLQIDSRTCQKYRILLSGRQRSNSLLEFSKVNVLGNMILSHWPCFTWKFFMIYFHKVLK